MRQGANGTATRRGHAQRDVAPGVDQPGDVPVVAVDGYRVTDRAHAVSHFEIVIGCRDCLSCLRSALHLGGMGYGQVLRWLNNYETCLGVSQQVLGCPSARIADGPSSTGRY